MRKSKNQNKRLNQRVSHVGGPMISNESSDVPPTFSDTTNPYEISDEEVRKKRAEREDKEDMQVFGSY